LRSERPLVIAHRGASGYRPEHTIASYALAIEMGADFIEPDLVSTRDGVLVARHECALSGTTDVARRPEFGGRRTTRLLDGVQTTDWFSDDFTLQELKTLRARERLPHLRRSSAAYDGKFEIPTLQEIIDLVKRAPRPVGIYPETKHPLDFDERGLSLEEPLVAVLASNGYRGAGDAVIIQSFVAASLIELREMTGIRLMKLLVERSLDGVAEYADGIGPQKTIVTEAFVREAHDQGLFVHPWTFRSENAFLPPELRSSSSGEDFGDYGEEYRRYAAMGVDGFFTDFPDHVSAKPRSASASVS
jgi:glycerophosphoryl diester phosphodiesterase